MQNLRPLIQRLASNPRTPISIAGARNSVAALLAATASHELKTSSILCVTAGESKAALLVQDLELFTKKQILYYPGYEIPPYTPLSPDPHTTAQRLSTLYNITTSSAPNIVVASAEALMRKVMPVTTLTSLAELIISGEETDLNGLVAHLTLAGYEQMSLVQNAGEFSLRGGILDIFAPGFEYPLRLDFFGDFIESIRLFDPITQRSIKDINEAEIIPVSDILFPAIKGQGQEAQQLKARLNMFSAEFDWQPDEHEVIAEKITNQLKFPGIEFFLPLFYDTLSDPVSYMPEGTVVVMIDPHEISRSCQLVSERIDANLQDASSAQSTIIPPQHLFLTESGLYKNLNTLSRINLLDFEEVTIGVENEDAANHSQTLNCGNHTLIKQHLELQRQKRGLLAPLTTYLQDWLHNGDSIHIACRSNKHASQLGQMLSAHDLSVSSAEHPIDIFAKPDDTIKLYPFPLSNGFDLLDDKIHILSELELFGDKRIIRGKKQSQKSKAPPVKFEELKIGDIVVHDNHGLGIYDGIINIQMNDAANDFLQIIYKDNDKLYVPVDRINSVSKYSGLSDKTPKISRLGGKAWTTAKKKVQEAVWKVAQDLLLLYARRQLQTGHAFSPPDSMYQELEESFAYDETVGQQKAINDVLADLNSEQCMDRLVCGDVGFGKTEVAIRAAFKVVCDGFQVAILVPTTVLAEQHAITFKERLHGFAVKVECLNRFRSAADQRKIIKELATGQVDIIIGTHRLLSKDVDFKRVGLLIIDEEHRFGVSHKEKLKKIRVGIDVLTLTATPIPRTLQMSLLGVRDLSTIQSPPRNRRSVKTFIAKYDDLVVKEAIVREMQRGGQTYLVHNRVRSIHDLAFRVQKLVPEAKIAVAHGQMPGKDLEEIMIRFVQQDIDVLICTTIIESGLDIPNANTIIINRADRMGLAAIYQLRGRVGRSNEQAYAYLLVPSLEHLAKDAKQRLRALMEYNELGGGFKLALSDLQIRGGGNILGESQSGNIAAVGYDLYLDLLQRTVEDLKRKNRADEGEEVVPDIDPEINLNISAFLAEQYIPDPDQRYIAYKRISAVTNQEELNDLKDEFTDRYGALPDEAQNLFNVVELKAELKPLRIIKLEQAPSALVFSFVNNTPVAPENILLFIQNSKNMVRLTPDSRLVVETPVASTESIFTRVKKVLHTIW